MAEYEPRLVHLPGTKLTPEVVLHRTLNKTEHIKSVTIVIHWNDDTFSIDWSQMKVSELVTAAALLDVEAKKVLLGVDEN